MKPKPKRVVTISIYEASDHWLIKFPHRNVVARDRTMASRLVRAYESNQKVTCVINWVRKGREGDQV